MFHQMSMKMKTRTRSESEDATRSAQPAPQKAGRGGRKSDKRLSSPEADVAGEVKQDAMDSMENTGLKQQVLDLAAQVEKLSEQIEKHVSEVTYMSTVCKRKGKSDTPAHEKSCHNQNGGCGPNIKNLEEVTITDGHEVARKKRMQELMRQFGTILKQISQHKWAWPFMKPVDVEGLGLFDYHDVVKNPMDLGTIREKLDAKNGIGYKHIQEICDDVRLVFTNAMSYNQDGSDVYVMAKTLSDKFEEKWKTALEPKLAEENLKRNQEERGVHGNDGALEEASIKNLAEKFVHQVAELNKKLEELKQKTTPICRAMSKEEKRQLGQSLGRLPPEKLSKAIQIIAHENPSLNTFADQVDIDIEAQNPATLWRLQRYVQAALSPEIAQEIHANKRIASEPKTKKMNKRSKLSVTP